MVIRSGLFNVDCAQEMLSQVQSGMIAPSYLLNEYRIFNDQRLFDAFNLEILAKVLQGSYFVHVSQGLGLHAWALFCEAEYDSSIFGFKVANVVLALSSPNFPTGSEVLFREIVSFAERMSYRYLTYAADTNYVIHQSLINGAVRAGFYYVNTLITFGFTKLGFKDLDLHITESPDLSIRLSVPEDYDVLYQIARDSYRIDRYHLDPNLPSDKCDSLYTESLRNSFYHGYVDVIFVALYKDEVVGYFSGKLSKLDALGIVRGTGVISAVSSKHRGRGAFQAMNKALLYWLNERSDVTEWGTYINNHPVHSVCTKSRMRLMRGSIQMGFYSR